MDRGLHSLIRKESKAPPLGYFKLKACFYRFDVAPKPIDLRQGVSGESKGGSIFNFEDWKV